MWAGSQESLYEFDGLQPVAVTGGTVNHSRVIRSLHRALDARLRGCPRESVGPGAGVETIRQAVRYSDALVTCSKVEAEAQVVPGVEYAAVPSIRRYVILESTSIGLTVMGRNAPDEMWRVTSFTNNAPEGGRRTGISPCDFEPVAADCPTPLRPHSTCRRASSTETAQATRPGRPV